MANMAARRINRTPTEEEHQFYGGFATLREGENKRGQLYSNGPGWFTEGMGDVY
jgi:hypothetical protein